MSDFTHFNEHGASRMVDVGAKPVTPRSARASGVVRMELATWQRIQQKGIGKGDVLEVARLAGIMAAKKTPDLIPLCHALSLSSVELDYVLTQEGELGIEATVKTTAQTGVEMEALTAVSVAALTIYDMCKAVDRSMVISRIQLEEKQGGASGHFRRDEV